MYNKNLLKKYFSNIENILIFTAFVTIIFLALFLRVRNLGYLAFWGDDGHTFTGTISIIEQGYPRLPSGNILWHGILGYYIDALFVLLFGASEFTFRLVSAFFGLGTVILSYFAGRDLANRYVGLLASISMALSSWYIHFSREVRYYSTLQFFYLISFYFFYRGFVRDERKYLVPATILICLTPLVHGIGFLLILLFVPLLLYKKRQFFRIRIIIPLITILGFYILQIINQVFFWQVGRSFYSSGNDFRSIIGAYLKMPESFYFKILDIMFPIMYWVVVSGCIGIVLMAVFMTARKRGLPKKLELDENEIKFGRLKLPYNIFNLYFILFSSILIISMGQMYNQQRYIYFLMPIFILVFAYMVYLLSFLVTKFLEFLYKRIKKRDINKVSFKIILVIIIAIISFFTIGGIDLPYAVKIPYIKHSDRLNTNYSISSSMSFHWDPATAGKYIKQNADENDIIITTNLYNSYPYTGRLDYWLWTGNLVSWAPYQKAGNLYIDDTFGIELIRSAVDLLQLFESEKERDIWITTSPSLSIPEHVSPEVKVLLDKYPDNFVLMGRDGLSGLYYFPSGERRPSFFDLNPATENNIIDVSDGIADIYFSDPENNRYLIFGMDNVEEGVGSWGINNVSILYLGLKENSSYEMTIIAKPLIDNSQNQAIDFFLDGRNIETIEFDFDNAFNQYVVGFSTGQLKDWPSLLKMQYKYSISPSELGITSDSRNLAVLFSRIVIEEIK